MASKIKTNISCENIAPIENLNKEIQSGSLKTGVFANNGSGKTFISRLFRITENQTNLELDDVGTSPTDKLISFGKRQAKFSFSIVDKNGIIKENFTINLTKGELPVVPKTDYLYHTFNQDYVEDNIRALGYEKNSEIEGYILGKVNIDLKDDKEKLSVIEKEEASLSERVEKEISEYLNEKINSIQNIKRLNEYKRLNFDEIFKSIEKAPISVSKSFQELLNDYNKIKSVPENLQDISLVSRVKIKFEKISEIKQNCEKEYTLSSLAEDFKTKVKEKQSFIEAGIGLIDKEKTICPFCEQDLENDALNLINNYTKYLTDTEAQTIKLFKSYRKSIEEILTLIKDVEVINTKRIVDFDTYKTKYIPSSAEIDLDMLITDEVESNLIKVIELINKKLSDISVSVKFEESLLEDIAKNQALLNDIIDSNNKYIDSINKKKNRINEESKKTRKQLCNSAFNHLVITHRSNFRNIIILRNDYKTLNEEIRKKRELQKVSKKDKVADTIKTILNYFFAEKYSLDPDTFRLVFKRNILEKNQAKNVLSEGEKNIVAFAYYIGDCHLKIENEDDYKKLFFVIDDPISSMDFLHVYTLSGVIRNLDKILDKLGRVKFLLFTHNNEFMRILSSNKILDKALLLKNGKFIDFNNNLTVPYINHLMDIYGIAKNGAIPTHTTANSIRHIIETLAKFDKIDSSRESVAEYIRENIQSDIRTYTLISDLSHGGWRSEQTPITNDEFQDICSAIIGHIMLEYKGQIDYCEKICKTHDEAFLIDTTESK